MTDERAVLNKRLKNGHTVQYCGGKYCISAELPRVLA